MLSIGSGVKRVGITSRYTNGIGNELALSTIMAKLVLSTVVGADSCTAYL